jgi:PBP1b-binding outer membrane lipoprotein LpoB
MKAIILMLWLALLAVGCASSRSGQPAASMSMAQPQTAVATSPTTDSTVTTSAAGQPQTPASPDSQSTAQQPKVTTQNGQTQTKDLANKQPQKQKLICSTEPMIGSHIQQHICLTPEQLAAKEKAAKQMAGAMGVGLAPPTNEMAKRNTLPPL